MCDLKMDDRIIDYNGGIYLMAETPDEPISNDTLDHLRDVHNNLLLTCYMYYQTNDQEQSLCRALSSHPRLGEFIGLGCDMLFDYIGDDPKVVEKFLEVLTTKIGEKYGSSAHQFEEFIAHINSTKSARK